MKATRIFAFALALTLVAAPLTGCGFAKEQDGATLELNMDNSWRTEQTLQSMSHAPNFAVDDHLLCSDVLPDNSIEFLWYDMETGEKTRFKGRIYEELDPLERVGASAMLLPDGNIGIYFRIFQNLGGGESETHRRCMEVYDRDMNYVETREIPTDFGEHPDFTDIYSGTSTAMDGDGNWYFCHYNIMENTMLIEVYNSDFEKYGELDVPANAAGNTSPILFTGADGTMYGAFTFTDSDYTAYQKIYRLDAENRTCEETRVTVPDVSYQYIAGTQGYHYYYITNDGLYGVKEDEETKVIDWVNSDFMPDEIIEFHPIADGTFILRDENRRYWLATPRTQEEIDSTKLISLATVEYSEDLVEAVIDYNREESGYRIVIKDYSEYNTTEEPHLGYDTMKQDMLDGIVADIICTDGVNFESLANKGLFADWYDFMDADEEFDREDYLQNFFEAYEYDGKLQRLGFSYTIATSAAQTQIAGETQGQSLGELLTLAEQEGIDFVTYDPAEIMAENWMGYLQTSCINRKTAECCFNSSEVVQFLELLSSIPQGDDFYTAKRNGEYAAGYEESLQDGTVLLTMENIVQPIDLRAIRRHKFFDADITLTGYPMVQDEGTPIQIQDRGNGGVFDVPFTVSINAQSTEHAAIWDFMKFFLSEDYQKRQYESMPIHLGALEYKLEEAEGMVSANVGGHVFIGEMEEWESDLLREYIHGIRTCLYYDQTVYDILMEETEKLFAGDQTAQECAEMMQSRVSIYLSEQA